MQNIFLFKVNFFLRLRSPSLTNPRSYQLIFILGKCILILIQSKCTVVEYAGTDTHTHQIDGPLSARCGLASPKKIASFLPDASHSFFSPERKKNFLFYPALTRSNQCKFTTIHTLLLVAAAIIVGSVVIPR